MGHPELSAVHPVGADGMIALPNVGAISIGSESVAKAEAKLTRRLSTVLKDPQVSLVVVSRSIEVTILGEVSRTGKFQLKSGDGVAAALAMAGGITPYGNENAVFLIRASEPLRIRFRMDDLLRGADSASAFTLRDGDLLVVE
jgi:polysaccharide export outer membrane protein